MAPLRVISAAFGGLLVTARIAEAGMPSIGVSEIGRLRLQTISFFLLGLLVSAGVIQAIWNSLRVDWPAVPRLTFWRSFGLVTLWGLMFLLVLTMISGARELLTPRAWEKVGFTYRVKQEPSENSLRAETTRAETELLLRRSEKLRRLGEKLREYAAAHDGAFPAEATLVTPDDLWEPPGLGRSRYLYVSGLTPEQSDQVLVREPAIFDGANLELLVNGEIRTASESAPQGDGP